MSVAIEKLVLQLAEEDFSDEDEDSFLVGDMDSIAPSEVEAALARAGFEKEEDAWVRRGPKRALTIRTISNNYYLISCYRRAGGKWEFSHKWESNLAGMEEFINRFNTGKVQENEDEDFGDDESFEFKDVLGPEDKHELFTFISQGRIQISGSVNRGDRHYVHENTTSVELNVEYPLSYDATEQEIEDNTFLQSKMEPEVTKLEEEINQNLRQWNKKIYRELEAAYDDYVSEEQVAQNILANEYEFEEDGTREKGGGFRYDQLSPEAQTKAREWWVQGVLENGETYYSESVIAEWKWLLKNKGFNGVEIAFSGFWSQGDGASFTAKSIDIEKYLTGPDPIEFPEQERDQLWESEDDDEDLDVKDVYEPGRKSIAHIATKGDYAEYQQRVADFFAREGINNLSSILDDEGREITNAFSKTPCEVCRRPLAGRRTEASGFNPQTREVQHYEVCPDCEYYAAYGQLDDQTMMDLKDDPLEEAEEDFGDEEVDFREVDIDNPTHGMKAGKDRIWSQPATQYHDQFPGSAWEIFVVRDAKPTKEDARGYRSVFIGILVKTNEGWHTIVATPSELSPPSQTAEEVVQKMFNQNKDYVWRGLGGN